MKITAEQMEDYVPTIVLEEVFSGVLLRQPDGNSIGVCMRDDTFEINIIPKGSDGQSWWRPNMQNRTMEKSGQSVVEKLLSAESTLSDLSKLMEKQYALAGNEYEWHSDVMKRHAEERAALIVVRKLLNDWDEIKNNTQASSPCNGDPKI